MAHTEEIRIPVPGTSILLGGFLEVPSGASGVVLFAHGSGSSRHSPRNRAVAAALVENGLATLLMDLLTETEDEIYENRFNIDLLTRRLQVAADWLAREGTTESLGLGCFGSSTGAAAALDLAASEARVKAVVSRGGRPDLARHIRRVKAPTLLIVGGNDREVLDLNRQAFDRIDAPKDLVVVPGATHLFEEPGALGEVARLACQWFLRYLPSAPA
jgi:putative phosphoribosyl transferase